MHGASNFEFQYISSPSAISQHKKIVERRWCLGATYTNIINYIYTSACLWTPGSGFANVGTIAASIILSNNCLFLKLLTRSCYSSSSWFLMKQQVRLRGRNDALLRWSSGQELQVEHTKAPQPSILSLTKSTPPGLSPQSDWLTWNEWVEISFSLLLFSVC